MRRAQFAMEYLLVVAFSVMLTIPLIWYLFQGYNDMARDVGVEQLSEVARELAFQAEKVYYQGPGSRSLVSAHFPSGVINASITQTADSRAWIEFEVDGFAGTIESFINAHVCEDYQLKTFSGPHTIKVIANASTGCIMFIED
jgi:hypothetical protein